MGTPHHRLRKKGEATKLTQAFPSDPSPEGFLQATWPPAKVPILRKSSSAGKTPREAVEKAVPGTGAQFAQGIMEAQKGVYLTLTPTPHARQGTLHTECQGVSPDVTVVDGH